MKVGIIVYSKAGNTYSVAEKLKEALENAGHSANIERIEVIDEKQTDINKIQIQSNPNLEKYDAIVFGAPVNAFSLCPAMNAYMSQINPLGDKKIACFVTKGLPFASTGGNQAIGQMKKICESKGGNISGSGVIVWNKDREKQITKMSEELSNLFR